VSPTGRCSGASKDGTRFVDDPGDIGWHIDGSFDVGREWWVNVRSHDRVLLMPFLFTDVGADDAPTRILVGSHLDVPPVLEPIGEVGKHFERVLPLLLDVRKRKVALAGGRQCLSPPFVPGARGRLAASRGNAAFHGTA